ncbi:MAG TPA: tetratricopeptide repeat protein, partial [Chryseosolibacter sp.]|nr:tetratricopeptide repeat protein [Chryseosolibacter sp.]
LTLKKNAQALKVFQLNTELYPGAWNTWDSLAEVYMIMGDNKKAVQYYEKSLALNAKNDNAKKYLTKLKEKKK